jgi:hypothetical protein
MFSIVLVEPLTMAIAGVIAPFKDMEDAVGFAQEDEACQKDFHWTVVSCEWYEPEDEEDEEPEPPCAMTLAKAKREEEES